MHARRLCIFNTLLFLAGTVAAYEPPRTMPADGAVGLNFSPELVSRFVSRMSQTKGTNFMVTSGRTPGVPSEGRPQILVLLIDFDDYPARAVDTRAAVSAQIFGNAGRAPYESLSSYYRRSSFGKLNIEGDVHGWIRMGRRADIPETGEARDNLIKKALLSLNGVDFSKYDGNGDGKIDHLVVVWTGPSGKWNTFWWPFAVSGLPDTKFTVGGKGIGYLSWQGVVENWDNPSSSFDTAALIHEIGHSIGLPDYYDYTPGVGPDGGLGYFDMMDGLKYDHNCFSKMMLGWIEPEIITRSGSYTIEPSHISGECLMILPPAGSSGPFGEFFLLENRRKSGNDGNPYFPGGGLVIWHVDARLANNGDGFMYNNQDTEHKLLRIMEADGKEEIEHIRRGTFGFDDFYGAGAVLDPATTPSSRLYDGADSHIRVISHGGEESVTLTIELE